MIRSLVALMLVVLLCIPVFAGELKGVKMPDTLTIEGKDLVLNGMALRKKVIFKVYVAGLYLPQKESDADKIFKSDGHRHMVMHFVRGVGAGKINGAWMEGLEDNTPNASPALKKQFDELCGLMEDVEDGEQIVFSYIPEKGTLVKVKGKDKGTLAGKPFADALFACWIGPEPGPGEDFREALLGKE